LIEDDVYGDLGYEEGRPKTARSFDREGNVLLCSSFSKTITPAYRVGYVAPGRFQQRVEHLKLVTNIGSATPTQLAVAHLLENGGYDQHLRRVRRIYRQQSALMGEAIGHYFPEGTRVSRPLGGYVLWVEMPPDVHALTLYERAMEIGISVAPGPLFSAQGKYSNCLRLNAACWSPSVEEALEKLGRLAACR
jgi:DNA-binding transcriptional MocR family regulator